MRIAPALLCLPLIGAAPAPELLCEGEAAMCRTVIAATQAMAGMLATADTAPFAEHLDEQAIYVTADGQQRSKAEMLALARSGPKREQAWLERLVVRGFGDTAVAVWSERWSDPAGDGAVSGVDPWMKRDGAWRIVATREAQDVR